MGPGAAFGTSSPIRPGQHFEGQNGDIAADHYHKWPEDIDLMKDMGLNSYRFSIRWPRILPEGTGAVNSAGTRFYDRLVDGCWLPA